MKNYPLMIIIQPGHNNNDDDDNNKDNKNNNETDSPLNVIIDHLSPHKNLVINIDELIRVTLPLEEDHKALECF